jgi:hypothetical protein
MFFCIFQSLLSWIKVANCGYLGTVVEYQNSLGLDQSGQLISVFHLAEELQVPIKWVGHSGPLTVRHSNNQGTEKASLQ